MNIKQQIANNT